jgi:uracil-DNA glycosylase family 4
LTRKPNFCARCPINHLTTGYVPFSRGTGNQLFIGEAAGEQEAAEGKPFVGGAGQWLNSLLKASKLSRPSLNIINTIGCRPPQNIFPGSQEWRFTDRQTARAAVEYCAQHHLRPAVNSRSWSRVVALGDQALRAVTSKAGISLWRGSPLPLRGTSAPKVMPTLHPAYIMRNSDLFSVVVSDLRKQATVPPEKYELWPTPGELSGYRPAEVAFDFEWDQDGNITLCGLSDRHYHATVATFAPEYLGELKQIFEGAKALIGHNIIGADMRHFERLGWDVSQAELYDTMLMQHLVQPDMPHSLAFTASVFTNKPFWKGKEAEAEELDDGTLVGGAQWRTWNDPDALPIELGGYGGCRSAEEAYRLYNARDTDASFQCAGPLLALLKRYGLEFVYWNVSVPAAFICRDMGEAGLRIDRSRLSDIRETLTERIAKLEQQLPEGLRPYEEPCQRQVEAPEGTYRVKRKVCRGDRKTKHPEAELLFEAPDQILACPVCGRELLAGKMELAKVVKVPGTRRVVPWNSSDQVMTYATETLGLKPVINKKTESASADKNARKVWGRQHTEFSIVDQLKKASTLRQSFAKEDLIKVDRMYFNLLVHGTAEGRLSSSGRRRGIDLNIQNQPKDIRVIYLPDYDDWGILNLDIVQGENMLTAWLAKDWERWERLNTAGFDEHSYMASKFFNKPIDLVMKDGPEEYLRKPGKIINHGRNYGLGVVTTVDYLAAEGFYYSQADVREMIEIWKRENRRTAQWQQETIETAERQGFLENSFGRKRWFQGKNFATKALAFLPASTLADMVLRMMIAHYPGRFAKELASLRLQVVGTLPDPWQLRIQVHDSLVSMGPHETHREAAHVTAAIMSQSWPQLDNFRFKVDCEYSGRGGSWGDCKRMKLEEPMRRAA